MNREGIPPGWSYNPASWSQRMPIIGLAVLGFLIATYLSLYQYEVIDQVWEPFFGDGSEKILKSNVSDVVEKYTGLPITDGALGAFSYLLDAIAGAVGGRKRWRTMPWLVVLFGLLVGPLGGISILLVILQPVLLDSWCTLCLATAAISIAMIGPAMDEVLASLQHLKRVSLAGGSVWRAFWGLSPERTWHDRQGAAAMS
jgi:hypothetical protein